MLLSSFSVSSFFCSNLNKSFLTLQRHACNLCECTILRKVVYSEQNALSIPVGLHEGGCLTCHCLLKFKVILQPTYLKNVSDWSVVSEVFPYYTGLIEGRKATVSYVLLCCLSILFKNKFQHSERYKHAEHILT